MSARNNLFDNAYRHNSCFIIEQNKVCVLPSTYNGSLLEEMKSLHLHFQLNSLGNHSHS